MVQIIKQAALEAYEQGAPSGIFFGNVVGVSPLKIQVEPKLILEEQHLLLTSTVQDFSIDMTVNHTTENTSGGSGESAFAGHSHGYSGRKTYKMHLGLKNGERVILYRVQGGQKYVVIDRIR